MKRKGYSTAELTHSWASGTYSKDEGRFEGSSIHFEGDKIYSYGWYLIGWRVNSHLVLLERDTYSSYTGKQLSALRRATTHLDQIYVDLNISRRYHSAHHPSLEEILEMQISFMAEICKPNAFYNIKNPRPILRQYDEHERNAEMLSKAMFLGNVPPLPQIPDREKWEEKANAWEEKSNERSLNRTRKTQERYDEVLKTYLPEFTQRFLAGESVQWAPRLTGPFGRSAYVYGLVHPVLLRIKGDVVNTSLGANVPLEDAKKLWKLIKAKAPIHGEHAGVFTVTSFADGLLKIGCHSIPETEIQRFVNAYPEIFPI